MNINNLKEQVKNDFFDDLLNLREYDKEVFLRELVFKNEYEILNKVINPLLNNNFDFNFNEGSLIRLTASYNSIARIKP